jgi:hypothetical protein
MAAKSSRMSSDFGADLEAALSRALGSVRGAAEAAKDRIDDAIAGVPSVAPASGAPPSEFDAPSPGPRHGAAVSFDIDESPEHGAVDDEGIPLREDF